MKKFITSLFSFLLIFGLFAQETSALSMIPTAMKKTEVKRQTSSQVKAEKQEKIAEVLWKDFVKLQGKDYEGKTNASSNFEIHIDADDILLDLEAKVDAIANILEKKIEEKITGKLTVSETFDYLDEPQEGSAEGSVNLKIIENDFFINIEDLSLSGEAEEMEPYINLLIGKWLHFNLKKEAGLDLWENNALLISPEKMTVNSPSDLEEIFTNLLTKEIGVEKGIASEIVAMFSFKEIFNIADNTESNSDFSSLKLTLNQNKFKYAMIKTGILLGEKLSREEIIEINNFLKNFTLEISFDYENATKEVQAIGFHVNMKNFEDLNNLDINLKINYMQYNENYEILPPLEYTNLNDAIFEAETEVETEWQEDMSDEEWEFENEGVEF